MKIKILRETPFDASGTILNFQEFRMKYGYICANSTSDDDLIKYLLEWQLLPPNSSVKTGDISKWFQIIPEGEIELPLTFLFGGITFSKQLDGLYHQFITGIGTGQGKSFGMVHVGEARRIFNESKYRQLIWFCTNDVNMKI